MNLKLALLAAATLAPLVLVAPAANAYATDCTTEVLALLVGDESAPICGRCEVNGRPGILIQTRPAEICLVCPDDSLRDLLEALA